MRVQPHETRSEILLPLAFGAVVKVVRGMLPRFEEKRGRAKWGARFKPNKTQLLIGGRILGI